MLADVNIGKQKHIQCKNCLTILENSDDLKTCTNCGFVVKEIQFESGNTFTDCKIDGIVYDLDEQQRDRSITADMHIRDMVHSLKIKSEYPEYLDRIGATPLRIIKFAYKGMFLDHGTNILHYSAAALYIALRFYKAPFLLMDFSDKLAVNLFKLAKCYRKLAKFLNVTLKLNEKLPAIDPSLYIPRFCKEIDFGDKTDKVKATAIKLLKRMKLDWMAHGRRPSSLCGAAILIAGRMHGFDITTGEVCQIVLVCEETLRKRLEEFKETEVASLTREKFDEIDIEKLQVERDPPAFIKNNNTNNLKLQLQYQQQQKQKALKADGCGEGGYNENYNNGNNDSCGNNNNYNNDNSQMKYQITNEKLESEKKDFDQMVQQIHTSLKTEGQSDFKDMEKNFDLVVQENKMMENQIIEQKMNLYNDGNNKIQILQERGEINEDESLSELSEEEQFILSKEEQTLKGIIWYKMNKEWLEDQQKRLPKLALEGKKDIKKRNKRRNDQLLNEDDPVFALMKSKNKKVKNNLDEKSLRELLQKSVMDVKKTQFNQVFENEQVTGFPELEYDSKPSLNARQELLKIEPDYNYNNKSNFNNNKNSNNSQYNSKMVSSNLNDEWEYDYDY